MTWSILLALLVRDNDSPSFSCRCLRRSQTPHKVRHHHIGQLRFAGTRSAVRAQVADDKVFQVWKLQFMLSVLFLEPATAAAGPAGAECDMCLIWHQRNQREMRIWTAAEGVFTAAHHAELTYMALLVQHSQSLPALQCAGGQAGAPGAVAASLTQAVHGSGGGLRLCR